MTILNVALFADGFDREHEYLELSRSLTARAITRIRQAFDAAHDLSAAP